MFNFTKLDGMAVFGAAAAEGPALTASYPYARPSFAQSSFVRTMKKLAVQWQAKRKVRRNVYALSALRPIASFGISASTVPTSSRRSWKRLAPTTGSMRMTNGRTL